MGTTDRFSHDAYRLVHVVWSVERPGTEKQRVTTGVPRRVVLAVVWDQSGLDELCGAGVEMGQSGVLTSVRKENTPQHRLRGVDL
jgi:hypothetical protein